MLTVPFRFSSFSKWFTAVCGVISLLGMGVTVSSAAQVEGSGDFRESFENYPAAKPLTRPWTVSFSGTKGDAVEVVADRENLFGNGRGNRILEYRKHGTDRSQSLRVQGAFSGEIVKIRFRYVQPEDELDGYTWLMLYAGSRATGNRAQVVTLGRDGSLAGSDATYERGQAYEIVLVVNNSARPTAYGENHVVSEGSVDIWIDGVLTESGFSHQNNQRGAITGLEFNTAGGRQHHFFMDDLTVEPLAHRDVPVGVAEQPATHPALTPVEGEVVSVNPPPMIWQEDRRAVRYVLELSRNESFSEPIRIEGIDMPFYNHSETLAAGTWYWRHFVVAADGQEMGPSPVRRFEVSEDAVELPIPPTATILAEMPDHPRVFTTPDDLEAFRARRLGPAKEAWEAVKWRADQQLGRQARHPENLLPLAGNPPQGPTPGMEGRWNEGEAVRRQVIWLLDGVPYVSPEYSYRNLNGDASRADILSFAYLISGDEQYAQAAKEWLLMVADARLDYHLKDRAHHDTVVYSYESGLKDVALSYDRLYHHLTEGERRKVVDHIAFHGQAAYEWLRDDRKIHLAYQQSHPQQALHAFLTTMLAVGNEFPEAAEWLDYLLRQYVNRIAWTSEDGGYFEGQTYGHKFQWILEGLVAIRTATGIDLFQQPRIANSGDFWLYAMGMNYWYHHGGDIYSLIWPWGNPADGYITGLVSTMNENPYVRWWSDTVYTNPEHVPFQYLSQTDLASLPPVDIPQARAFVQTGQVAAYDRFYDHRSDRIFFRSSPWGGHSHSHADQNNFVIHSGAEILAADVGYYTYYGDDYHRNWSRTTFTHNTILINGEGQPKSIDSKGRIASFFHTPEYTFFSGDASRAYPSPMERFERAILFIRPGIYVVYDELKATEPSEFSWLLNAFQEAEIDPGLRTLTVPQQDRRLRVRHLLPRNVLYEQSNERRYPVLTRAWARVSEAYPEPYHIRVNTAENARDQRFLALLNTYDGDEGDPLQGIVRIDNPTTHGLRFSEGAGEETVLFRRHLREPGVIQSDDGIRANGLSAAVRRVNNEVATWFLAEGSGLEADGIRLAGFEISGNAAGLFRGPGSAVFRVASEQPQTVRLYLPERPESVWFSPEAAWGEAEAISFTWDNAALTVAWPGGEGTLWVDPAWSPAEPLPELTLEIRDSEGKTVLPLRTMVAENGDWVGYAEVDPREVGRYVFESTRSDVEILIQDRLKPRKSAEGVGSAEGDLRPKSELFFRFNPAGELPVLRARLAESHRGQLVNFLRNGDFEEGIPDYPPRGWVVRRSSRSPDVGWPGWSQEEAFSGNSSLKFTRPTDTIAARAQPMRLPAGGKHWLRFQAKGDATQARVVVDGRRGTGGSIRIEPSENWRAYELELDMAPGYTEIVIEMNEGGRRNQTLWLDAMEFGPEG